MDQNLSNKELVEKDQQYYLPTFKRYPLALASGKGTRVWDVEGNEYLDVFAGIAVNNLGHCHPRVVEAIREQAGKLIHISNFFVSPPQVELSELLCTKSGMTNVFLTNSGAESVEGAIKLARKYAHSKDKGGTIISMHGSFHGRTMATIATGKKAMQEGFAPIPEGFKQVPLNDLDAVKDAVDDKTAAIIIEPIQGEGGINPAEDEFLRGLRELCDEHDIILIFDEIQCGIGRTGKLFAKDHSGVQPDIITLAKGLGSGMPVGAILANDKIGEAIDFGDHGTTFGGNPLACSAALATLYTLDEEPIIGEAAEKGEWLRKQVESWNDPDIKEIRGKGLMIGIEFAFETKPLVAEMMKHGILANATAGNVLRLVPPLTISYEEMERVLDVIKESKKALPAHG